MEHLTVQMISHLGESLQVTNLEGTTSAVQSNTLKYKLVSAAAI